MKSKRLFRLQTWTIIALVVYLLMAIYMFFAIPTRRPMWSIPGLAEKESQRADLQQLQRDLRQAVGDLSSSLHYKDELLNAFFVATVGIVGFLGWSVFMIGRIKREDLL